MPYDIWERKEPKYCIPCQGRPKDWTFMTDTHWTKQWLFSHIYFCAVWWSISVLCINQCNLKRGRISSHNFKWLWNVWHVLMTSKNMSLNAFLAVCSIRAIWAFLVRLFATFPAQMSLQVSFSSINPATFATTMRDCWSHIPFLLRGDDPIPNSFCPNFTKSSVQGWEMVSCKTCKN